MSRTLSIVIPVYNERGWIADTVKAASSAVAEAGDFDAEILVVDDGSTDGTPAVVTQSGGAVPVRVLTQENGGRFAARARGLDLARGEYVLFLDARVRLLPGSLAFVSEQLRDGPDSQVWNAHCVIAHEGNPYGEFWNVLTELAFSEYFDDPRTTSFDAESFERFPKGTTCFLAPRTTLREAFDHVVSRYADLRYANDDTPIIRSIADRQRINISPRFSCLYRPRNSARAFTRHAFHRGVVFLDGHGRRESSFFPLVVAFYPVSALAVAFAVRRPFAIPAGAAAVSLTSGAVAAMRGRTIHETFVFGALSPVYATAHGAGMWRGLALACAESFRRRTDA